MDHFDQLVGRVRRHLLAVVLLNNLLLVQLWWVNEVYFHVDYKYLLVAMAVVAIIVPIIIAMVSTNYILQPLRAVWQAVLHIAPGDRPIAAPKVEELKLGRELVSTLTAQIYQLTTAAEHPNDAQQKKTAAQATFILRNLPLPLLLLNHEQTIIFANDAAAAYLELATDDLINMNVYSMLDMSFPSTSTLDSWLGESQQNNATATNTWERVRLNPTQKRAMKLFDLAAYYNKANSDGLETMLVLFDHTDQYSQDDQAISFMALAVHELRTPLTMLRGYIEVFEDELGKGLDPELTGFMKKMRASAEQLTAFVNNILNVARVDEDELVLKLHEEDWLTIIKQTVETMSLRAAVRGITLEVSVADKLPKVGVDRVGIQEVLYNLIDNAIKYSGESKKIVISASMNREHMVETSIQDFGVGIPQGIMPHLFSKFYRDHHHRAQIGGTGLGLYLSKAIVAAHGGNIWVRSKIEQGSTFTFTLLPYDQINDEQKGLTSKEITRSAHGWIKNHSLYRR